jgi:hypothetical protein
VRVRVLSLLSVACDTAWPSCETLEGAERTAEIGAAVERVSRDSAVATAVSANISIVVLDWEFSSWEDGMSLWCPNGLGGGSIAYYDAQWEVEVDGEAAEGPGIASFDFDATGSDIVMTDARARACGNWSATAEAMGRHVSTGDRVCFELWLRDDGARILLDDWFEVATVTPWDWHADRPE